MIGCFLLVDIFDCLPVAYYQIGTMPLCSGWLPQAAGFAL
jgi:hypothetical protein